MTIVSAANLTITAAAGAPSAVAGTVVGYTITIANSGSGADPGVSVTAALDGVLDDAAFKDAAAVLTGTSTPTGTCRSPART